MAAQRDEEPLRQTIFLEVAEELWKDKDARFIADTVLRVCQAAEKDILCLQSFGQGLHDVSFYDAPVCAAALERLKAAEGRDDTLRGIDICLGSARHRVPLTVHVQDPFLPEETLEAFLRPYCERVGKGQKLKNSLGVWNGKRKFAVILKLDDVDGASLGDRLHPPAVFSIGDCRGSLTYPGQPKYCAICSTSGHCKAECREGVCPHCHDRGHEPEDCHFKVEDDYPWWEEEDDFVPLWVDNSCGGRG